MFTFCLYCCLAFFFVSFTLKWRMYGWRGGSYEVHALCEHAAQRERAKTRMMTVSATAMTTAGPTQLPPPPPPTAPNRARSAPLPRRSRLQPQAASLVALTAALTAAALAATRGLRLCLHQRPQQQQQQLLTTSSGSRSARPRRQLPRPSPHRTCIHGLCLCRRWRTSTSRCAGKGPTFGTTPTACGATSPMEPTTTRRRSCTHATRRAGSGCDL